MKTLFKLFILATAGITACGPTGRQTKNNTTDSMQTNTDNAAISALIPAAAFDSTINGHPVKLYYLKSKGGVQMAVTNYGAKVVALLAPDKNGQLADVVLGYDNLARYLNTSEQYYGGVVGRYGNRIAKGKFRVGDNNYTLAVNNGENHLHGGINGYNAVVWEASQPDDNTLVFHYLSKDGEEGYPGNLDITMTYSLSDKNEFRIDYKATTDKATVVNLTHHSFFNLKGAGNGNVLDHIVTINASRFTPVDAGLIPTGQLAPVKGTPMDFTSPTPIGQRVDENFEQLKLGKGYDHNWVLDKQGKELSLAATVTEPESGRRMEVWTTEPGVQFYGGNFMKGTDIGKQGKVYAYRGACCFETQHFPDSPNQPGFPSVVLEPGTAYQQTCIYKFSTQAE